MGFWFSQVLASRPKELVQGITMGIGYSVCHPLNQTSFHFFSFYRTRVNDWEYPCILFWTLNFFFWKASLKTFIRSVCLIYKSLWGINAWHLSAASDIHSDGYCQYRAGWMDLCRSALPTIIWQTKLWMQFFPLLRRADIYSYGVVVVCVRDRFSGLLLSFVFFYNKSQTFPFS